MAAAEDNRRDSSPNAIADRDAAFALFIDSVKDYAIFILDPDGHILTWNIGAERLKGYRADEIIGRHFSVFYSPEDRAAGKPARMLAAAAADGRVEDEGWRVRKDGARFWADVVITALRDSKGALVGFGKVTRDMSDIRARRAALEEANAQLRNINQTLETFARSMTHDISGPLRTIRAFSEILLEDYAARLDEEGQDYLRRIASGAQRLSRLIQSLLVFLRLTRSGEIPAAERVSWDTVAADVIRDLQWDIERRGAVIDVRGPLGQVLGYRPFVVLILGNLLSNALKFVAPGVVPTITISADRRDGRVRLIVEDNGLGIPAGEQQVIFEAFKRLHPHASFEGSGLGLAIVQHAVTRMGGSYGVESEVGQGSRFWVELRAPE